SRWSSAAPDRSGRCRSCTPRSTGPPDGPVANRAAPGTIPALPRPTLHFAGLVPPAGPAMQAPITTKGAQRLRAELEALKSVKRPAVINAIAEARAHGDLNEDAAYPAAREQQGVSEARVR